MKITKRQLRRIIREEKMKLKENPAGGGRGPSGTEYLHLRDLDTGRAISTQISRAQVDRSGTPTIRVALSNMLTLHLDPDDAMNLANALQSVAQQGMAESAVNEGGTMEIRQGHIEAKYSLTKNGYDLNQPMSSPQNDMAIEDALDYGRSIIDDFNYDDIVYVVNNWNYIPNNPY